MRMLIAGGGTGGHLFPGIAIGEAFRECAPGGGEILFVGTPRGLEAKVLPERGLPYELLEVGALKGLSFLRKLSTLVTLPLALLRAARIVLRFKPDVVIGVGGYVSGPVVLAARLLGKKTAIQEQNSVPGLTNRILGKVVHQVFTAFEAAAAYFPQKKVRLLGNPIRKELSEAARQASVLPEKPAVLILGGSQGARKLNEVLPEVYGRLAGRHEGLSWTHQTGEQGADAVRERYASKPAGAEVVSFISDMKGALLSANLVIGRAGASTLAEVTALGRPAVLIPFPFATDNHQETNARELEEAEAAVVVLEKDLSSEGLADLADGLLGDRARLEEMARHSKERGLPGAAGDIARECISLVQEGRR